MKILYMFIILLFFQGCISSQKTINLENQQTKQPKRAVKIKKNPKKYHGLYSIETQKIKDERLLKFKSSIYTGSIKGIVKNIVYDKTKKLWIYEIRGLDTNNGKLPYAKFIYHSKLANRGDLVYAILDKSVLQNLFFIKKGNIATPKHKKYHKRKYIKKSSLPKQNKWKKIPKIGLPTVENVTF